VLKACDVVPDDDRTGRAADIAYAASATTSVVDATAVRHQARILTSDRAVAVGAACRVAPHSPGLCCRWPEGR
jgi:hypothetical protein